LDIETIAYSPIATGSEINCRFSTSLFIRERLEREGERERERERERKRGGEAFVEHQQIGKSQANVDF